MHQIRQKKPKPSKRNATSSSIAPTSGARPTSGLVRRAGSSNERRRARSSIAPRDLVDRAARRRGSIVRRAAQSGLSLLSLSLSLFFRKLFEVKMRGENDFRVKGENIGQPKVIFRKMIFSVTAKHSDFMENDFRKQFSPDSNTPLNIISKQITTIYLVYLLLRWSMDIYLNN